MSEYQLLLAARGETGSHQTVSLELRSTAGLRVPWADELSRAQAARDGNLDGYQLDTGAHPEDLRRQGWRVFLVDSERGRAQHEQLRPLLERRAAEIGRDVDSLVTWFPRALTDAELDFGHALDWTIRHVDGPHVRDRDIPLYRLLIGDLDEIPVTVQQALALFGPTGRLAFDEPAHYGDYAAKIIRWETAPSPHAEADISFYTADDGGTEIERGHRTLIERSRVVVFEAFECDDDMRTTEPVLARSPSDATDEFLAAVAGPRPRLLMTLSHGRGASPAGWPSYAEQRAHQGSMCLGRAGVLGADHVNGRAFLPGGVWFMHACFSAGTPARSLYADILAKSPEHSRAALERSLPQHGGAPFISALAKAALRNPDGPLAFVGHVDLAWTYAFTDGPGDHRGHVWPGELMSQLGKARRVGLGMRTITRALDRVHARLAHDRLGQPQQQFVRAWMQQRDLASFILLGDPAARLPVAPRELPVSGQ